MIPFGRECFYFVIVFGITVIRVVVGRASRLVGTVALADAVESFAEEGARQIINFVKNHIHATTSGLNNPLGTSVEGFFALCVGRLPGDVFNFVATRDEQLNMAHHAGARNVDDMAIDIISRLDDTAQIRARESAFEFFGLFKGLHYMRLAFQM